MASIKVYGAPWCPDCRRTKKFLGEHRVNYDWIDIDQDVAALRHIEELQGGGRTIPTVVFEDDSYLLEPQNEELARKLGLSLEADRGFYDLTIIGGGPAPGHRDRCDDPREDRREGYLSTGFEHRWQGAPENPVPSPCRTAGETLDACGSSRSSHDHPRSYFNLE